MKAEYFLNFLMFNEEWSSETGARRSRRAPTRNVAPRGAHEGEHGRRAPTLNVAPRGAHEGEHGRRAPTRNVEPSGARPV